MDKHNPRQGQTLKRRTAKKRSAAAFLEALSFIDRMTIRNDSEKYLINRSLFQGNQGKGKQDLTIFLQERIETEKGKNGSNGLLCRNEGCIIVSSDFYLEGAFE